MSNIDYFCRNGKVDSVLGGQFGSEGKGAAIAWLAMTLAKRGRKYDIITTNAGSQAGHTCVLKGTKYVTRHLPTAPLAVPAASNLPVVYINAGSIIDPDVFEQEYEQLNYADVCAGLFIHPNAAVITKDCIAAEQPDESVQARIGSTRKGVGEAIARKVQRCGVIARDHPFLKKFVRRIDLNARLNAGSSVLMEIPQGYGLSLNGKFYPHSTSRDCTVMQALSDAHIHPHFIGRTLLVLRTFPIRVGGPSGGCYPDQKETDWETVGAEPEITTVTKRVRRVFTWSQQQVIEAMAANRPDAVFLSHCDYESIERAGDYVLSIMTSARSVRLEPPALFLSYGPAPEDVRSWMEVVPQQKGMAR